MGLAGIDLPVSPTDIVRLQFLLLFPGSSWRVSRCDVLVLASSASEEPDWFPYLCACGGRGLGQLCPDSLGTNIGSVPVLSVLEKSLSMLGPLLPGQGLCWNIRGGVQCVFPRDRFYLVLYIQGHLYKIQHFHTM